MNEYRIFFAVFLYVFLVGVLECRCDFLGTINFDTTLLDKIPVHSIKDIPQLDDETKENAFKWTDNDIEAFYGLLKACKNTVAGTIERAAKDDTFHHTDLFNEPAKTRGKPVLLIGKAKRILEIPVKDEYVRNKFGIDRYYQIYLFTDESQGNPLVVCVSSLPEDMPIGDGKDFSVTLAVGAVLYKLWIYDAVDKQHYAPLLIGRCPQWNGADGQPEPPKNNPRETYAASSITVFFTLMLIWYLIKLRRRRVDRW